MGSRQGKSKAFAQQKTSGSKTCKPRLVQTTGSWHALNLSVASPHSNDPADQQRFAPVMLNKSLEMVMLQP
jgi:hypothetical protein